MVMKQCGCLGWDMHGFECQTFHSKRLVQGWEKARNGRRKEVEIASHLPPAPALALATSHALAQNTEESRMSTFKPGPPCQGRNEKRKRKAAETHQLGLVSPGPGLGSGGFFQQSINNLTEAAGWCSQLSF